MSEEQNRFSLRKLSVGLASVLIGVSIFGTSQAVKADTVANNQTSSVTNNAQSSDTQENKNVAKSRFSNDNQANNAKSNLIQTQVEGKNEQKQDSVPKTQEVNDGSNLDAEKSIVRTSSLQEPDNQSNNHAEDNSQTQPQNSKKLDLTKNSQKLAKKVLAVNLTENQAINDSTDPSQIDPSHFADGTHWTTAGWTRTDKNTKVAKKGNLILSDWTDGTNDPTVDRMPITDTAHYYAQDLTFTIDKDDLKAGNKILVATIQHLPTDAKQKIDGTQPSTCVEYGQPPKYDITYNNQTIGNITINQLDNDELDYYFNPTTTLKLASDPSFTYHLKTQLVVGAYARQQYHKNHTNLPSNYCIVSNFNVREYYTYVDKSQVLLANQNDTMSWYLSKNPNAANPLYAWVGLQNINPQHQLDPTTVSDDIADYVVKIQTLDGTKFDLSQSRFNVTSYINALNHDGKITTEELYELYDVDTPKATRNKDNLSSIDLWNSTSVGHASYSIQKDGSVLLCMKLRPNNEEQINKIDKNRLKSAVEGTYLANVQDPDHYQQIVDNTVNKTKGWYTYISSFQLLTPATYQITDVTPTAYSKHNNLGTTNIQWQLVNHHGDMPDLETYKNVKISYVDDDDNSKSVSSDAMTGRQNKASTYTVNIPKGYYLDDNNTSTGYTWNADHTAISYTFNEDQAKNDANPIKIHLKHKHTAITDSSQLQITGKRTITITLPHQEKPMIIVQTVGYKRTGTYDEVIEASNGLDEAEKEGNYTDWVLDADTSNVTVDGQLSTQYQAYVLKDGIVNYAPIKLPHINGYKAHLVRNKINPAMLMVSFMAVPSENKPSTPVEETPSKLSAPTDNSSNSAWTDLKHKVVNTLNQSDSGWTMPENNSTYTVEVPDDAIIDLSDLVIAEPVHAQTRAQIHVNKRFKLSKKHSIKHLKHRKKAVRTFRKYRL